ncbi:hypothetical protein PG984_015388 [Apiospora sp. TS-2023a]
MSDLETDPIAFPTPVNPDDQGIWPLMIGIICTFTSLALIIIAVRLYVRIFHSEEGWAIRLAYNGRWGYHNISYQWGLSKDPRNLTYDPRIMHILKWNPIASIPGIVVSISTRISIAVLLVRLFGRRRWFKWYLISVTAAASEMFYCLQVQAMEGFWTPGYRLVDWIPQ